MPTIEVWLNEKSLAVGGGNEFELLTLGVLGDVGSGFATAQLTGWRKLTGDHFQWFCVPLRRQDKVRAVLRREGTATPAIIWSADKKDSGHTDLELAQIVPARAERHSLTTFRVSVGKQTIRASANTLQATATWHSSRENLVVEMSCVDNRESGGDNFYLETTADPDEIIELEIC